MDRNRNVFPQVALSKDRNATDERQWSREFHPQRHAIWSILGHEKEDLIPLSSDQEEKTIPREPTRQMRSAGRAGQQKAWQG